jgi:D-threo-aldose 1-dehydrogenase
LGATGIRLPRIGLGTAPLGGLYAPVSDADAEATLAAAWACGIRFFDTAPLYGFGLAERRLGVLLRSKPRDSFVLSTKVGRLLRESADTTPDPWYKGTPPERPVFDFSHDGVLRSFEESLVRLGLDRVDIVLIHDPDDHHDEALQGAYRALDRLRGEGTIRAVGAGMNQAPALARFAEEGRFDCFLLAGRYSLLDQSARRELLERCAAKGIGVIVGGVFNSGVLADPDSNPKYDYHDADAALVHRARELRAVCESFQVPLRAAALRFPFGHPAVASVVVGARTAAEIEDNVRLFGERVPAGLWAELGRRRLIEPGLPTPAEEL